MNWRKATAILVLLMSVANLVGCGGAGSNTNGHVANGIANVTSDNSNAAKTNSEELGVIVNIPYEAEDIVWKQDAGQKNLIAVFRFSTEDAAKLVSEASSRRPPQNVTLSSEPWFPAELVAQSEMTGDDALKGVSYAADSFFEPPYTSGQIVRIDSTDYFILELFAK